jgi:hypothetical protein
VDERRETERADASINARVITGGDRALVAAEAEADGP